jgi:hypothetical protein
MNTLRAFILFLILSLNFTFTLYSQVFWKTLPFPDSTDINCIAVNSTGDIFVGAGSDGGTGGVYRSQDEGQTWEFVLNIGSFGVLSLEINSGGTVYAGTNRGNENLWVSYDNGQEWEQITMPYTENVVKIYCKGPDTLYVSQWVGGGALLLRSPDGGLNWETIYSSQHVSEYVSDIAISSVGYIYVSLNCYILNQGGVYKSTDNGVSWEYVGLFNNQVRSVEFNSNDDLFITTWSDAVNGSGGLFALYHGASEVEPLFYGPSFAEMVINSNNDIYCADVPGGIIRSTDNGQTFEYVNEGLAGASGILAIDNLEFIYAASFYGDTILAKTIQPTYVSIKNHPYLIDQRGVNILQNPVKEVLHAEIQLPGKYIGQSNIAIIDLTGRLILCKSVQVRDNILEVIVSSISPGVYLLKIDLDNECYKTKFIKF